MNKQEQRKAIIAANNAGEIYTKEYFQEKGRKGAKKFWEKQSKEKKNAHMERARAGRKTGEKSLADINPL